MKINCVYILVFVVNVILCLPQSNQHESSKNVTVENKGSEYKRNLRGEHLDKQEEKTDANKFKNLDINEKVGRDVFNTNEAMYTNQRFIPRYYENVAPRRWLSVPSRYIIPRYMVPRAPEQMSARYDAPFEKEVRETEVVAEPHNDEAINKKTSINPMETVYMVPPQIAYAPGPAEEIIPTPYLGAIPLDPDRYNPQEIGVPINPLIYPSPNVDPRHFRKNRPEPYYRYPRPSHVPVNKSPLPFDLPRAPLYQEPLPQTMAKERITGPGASVEDRNVGNKHQVILEHTNDTNLKIVKNDTILDGSANIDIDNINHRYTNQYPKYYYPRRETNQKSQDNNFEFSDVDTTKISSFVNPSATYDFNNFDDGHPMYFLSNKRERYPQIIDSSYKNPGLKEKIEITKDFDDSGSVHDDEKVAHEPNINEQNYQYKDNTDPNLKEDTFEISNATDNSSHINDAFADTIDFTDWSKTAKVREQKVQKEKFDYGDSTRQDEKLDISVENVSKVIESNDQVMHDKIVSKESATDTYVIFTGNDDIEDKSQESHDNTKKKDHGIISNEILKPELLENIERNESTMESYSIHSNESIHQDSIETKSDANLNNADNRTIRTDIYDEEVNIEATTQLQPNYVIEKEKDNDQYTNTPQIEAPMEYRDKSIIKIDNSSNAGINTATVNPGIQITPDENSLIDINEMNSNETIDANKKEINTANDVQPSDYIETGFEHGNQERFEHSIEDSNQNNETNYEMEMKVQVENEPVSDSEINDKKDDEKSILENDEEHIIKYESTSCETTSNIKICNRQEKDEKSSSKNPDPENHTLVLPMSDAAVTKSGQDILAPSISDTNSNEDNDDDLNDSDISKDQFDEISSASQTSTEESIKSNLRFKTTCIRHPVDISTDENNSKNAVESMRFEFYRKIFDEYIRNHNFTPLTVTEKDIRSFVYKNGTIVNMITQTVWDIENDWKPVEIRTKEITEHRNMKISNQN